MKLKPDSAPHIRFHETARVIMGDVILAMLIVYVMAFLYYGFRVIVMGLVSVLTALLAEWICLLIAGKRPTLRDLSPIVTGMLIPLLMPASIPFHVIVTAVVFGIVAAKHPFGGTGHNVFNPAAAGFAFAVICFGQQLFSYPMPQLLQSLPLFPTDELLLVNSPAFTLNLGGVPNYSFVDLSLGSFPGPMGATNILVLFACLLYLVFRGTVRWILPSFFLLTAALMALLFPRSGMSGYSSVMMELMSGMLLIGCVFMLGDPVTTPKRSWSKAAFGITAGVIVMLFRQYGHLEESFVYAVLLMNATVWAFDMLGERLAKLIRGKSLAVIDDKKLPKKS